MLLLASLLLAATASFYTIHEANLNRQLSELVVNATTSQRVANASRADAAVAESAARHLQQEATRARDQASQTQRAHRDLLYAAHVKRADTALRAGDIRGADDFLNREIPPPGAPDSRGFEWHWLRRHMHTEPPVTEVSLHNPRCVRFSPNAQWLAVGDSMGVCWLLDATTKEVVRSWPTTHEMVESVSFSPSSSRLATTGHDGVVSVWAPQTAALIDKFEVPGGPFWQADFIDETRLLVSSRTGPTIVLDTAKVKEAVTLGAGFTEVFAIAASTAGGLLAQLGHDGVKVFRSDSFENSASIAFGRSGGKTLCLSQSGKRLACDTGAHQVSVYDVQDPRVPKPILVRTILDEVRGLSFSPDESWLAVCSNTGSLHVWSLDSEDLIESGVSLEWQAHQDRANSVSFSPTGEELVSVARDDHLRVWNPSPRRLASVLSEATFTSGHIADISLSPTGEWLAAGNEHGIVLWEIETRGLRQHIDSQGRRRQSVVVSPDGKRLAAAGDADDPFVEMWEVSQLAFDGNPSWRIEAQGCRCLTFSPDSRQLIVADWSGDRTLVLDSKTGSVTSELETEQCWWAACSPDGGQLAVAMLDHIDVWDCSTWKQLLQLRGHSVTTTTVAYSPDGQWLASGSKDRSIRLWDVASGRERFRLLGHLDWVEQVAFSPDSRSLVSTSRDGAIKVWHAASGELLCDLWRDATNRPFRLAFDPAGRFLAVRVELGQILLFDIAAEK
jgi:WD40 repeat protein